MESAQANDIQLGKVTGITSFGAFIKMENGQEGLVHISELTDSYVKSISDFLEIGQEVKVKVLGINKKNKLDLSIKKVPNYRLESKNPQAPETRRVKREKALPNTFEEKLNVFLKNSDEKQLDLRKNIQSRQGVKKRKKKGKYE